MTPIEIRSGLRKLEFNKDSDSHGTAQEAVVEFVRATPFPAHQNARVSLGRRDGVLRELVGEPQLIETKDSATQKREYLYRVRGPVTTVPD
jgi:hypothetical protein